MSTEGRLGPKKMRKLEAAARAHLAKGCWSDPRGEFEAALDSEGKP